MIWAILIVLVLLMTCVFIAGIFEGNKCDRERMKTYKPKEITK